MSTKDLKSIVFAHLDEHYEDMKVSQLIKVIDRVAKELKENHVDVSLYVHMYAKTL